jgi:hypothetical protein
MKEEFHQNTSIDSENLVWVQGELSQLGKWV